TLFMFILASNLISVIPYFESPTKDLNVTFSFGLLVFFMSQFFAMRRKGVGKYFKGFIEPYPFMLPLNIVGELARPLSHSFRLFGNMFGGAIMLSIVYIFPFTSWVIPIGLNFFYGLFVGTIQAFVFSLLAVAYINVAVET
ncbi:MAG TPA: ATP synthase F0 subunit A, partial [Candidatus Acetothermia bacterium]|nr:ATP synthase F0 subunit A [Candidatus Acetothermia bacterium]